ncbi:hypothetical protein TNCV_3652601 [Trichonephila clavipes]|nr:hypothetical protein TNCV_3652601 [Trichonephila clavipes]
MVPMVDCAQLKASYYPKLILKDLLCMWRTKNCETRLRSGDLLIETMLSLQTEKCLSPRKTFLDSPVTVSPHKLLNSCRSVLSETVDHP